VTGRGRQVLKFLIEALWDVALFQLVKGDFPQGIFPKISGANSEIPMDFYFKKMVIFFVYQFLTTYLEIH
jgi:hypothetical protein